MSSEVVLLMFGSIWGLAMGATYPSAAFIAYRYVALNRHLAKISQLVWGAIWRFFATFYAVTLIAFVFSAPFLFFGGSDYDDFLSEAIEPYGLIGINVGFWGGVAVFIVAYRRGRKERHAAGAGARPRGASDAPGGF